MENAYYKIGISNPNMVNGKIIVVEVVTSEVQVNKARQAYSTSTNMVYAKHASKIDFAAYSDGKIMEWN